MRRLMLLTIALVVMLAAAMPVLAAAQDDPPAVHAVMFYSPSCGHCEYVITQVLPPLMEQYGQDQLKILLINVSVPGGQTLYQAAVEAYDVPENRMGVPNLIVGDISLVGSQEIPELFPGIIEETLAAGGNDWPPIPGLAAAIPPEEPVTSADEPEAEQVFTEDEAAAEVPAVEGPAPADDAVADDAGAVAGVDDAVLHSEDQTVLERIMNDPAGNGLAIVVLAGMVTVFGVAGMRAFDTGEKSRGDEARALFWLVPLLSVIGIAVAGYLAWVETTNSLAVCGPVGNCNAVQQSSYARLFGILPIGVLGVIGYIVIIGLWAAGRFGPRAWDGMVSNALFFVTGAGLAFSVYLTFLEPFVIGATCAWCLTSAILMTVLFWFAAEHFAGRLRIA